MFTSIFLIIAHGLKFDADKVQLWLVSFLTDFVPSIRLTQPRQVKLFILASTMPDDHCGSLFSLTSLRVSARK